MLISVGERTPPCGTPVLNWRCLDVSVLIFRRILLGYYAEGMHANF